MTTGTRAAALVAMIRNLDGDFKAQCQLAEDALLWEQQLLRGNRRDRTGGKYAKARELRAKGMTIRQIQKRLGYKSTCSVAAALKQGN